MTHGMAIAHLAALFTILIWGVTFISTKILLAELTPFEILALRFILGWLALWLMRPVWGGWMGRKMELMAALAGLTGVTLYFLLENVALTYTSVANVSVLVSVAPFFTGICDWLIMRGQRPRANFFIGFILAICGIGLVSWSGRLLQLNPLGDVLSLGAALAWGLYSIFVKRISHNGPGTLVVTRKVFFYGLLLMLPCLAWERFNFEPGILARPAILFNLAFLGIGASAICFAIWTFCIRRLGAEAASAYIYLVPVVSVLAAAIILDEKLTAQCLLGCGLTIAGLAVSELGRIRK